MKTLMIAVLLGGLGSCLDRIPTDPPSPPPASPSPVVSVEPSPCPAASPCPVCPTPTPEPTAPPTPAPTPSAAPTPAPAPTPDARLSCNVPLVRVGIGESGGEKDRSCTFRFGEGNGKPCDGAHLACNDPRYNGQGQCEPCGGAVCEDPRGCVWTASDGLILLSPGEGEPSFGARVKGSGKLKACPPPDPVSRHDGKPLRVNGNACTTVVIR